MATADRGPVIRLQGGPNDKWQYYEQDFLECIIRDSGLGAPDDIHSLQPALIDRENNSSELRRQLEERDDELAGPERPMVSSMTQLNTRA